MPGTASGIPLRTPEEIDALDASARVVADALRAARQACVEGVTTAELDAIASESFRKAGAESLFKGYGQGSSVPFPADTCISVNEEVVHGIPGSRKLAAGDLVCVDVGIRLNGWCGDSATSVVVGGHGNLEDATVLQSRTRDVLELGISMVEPGRAWSEVGLAMERLGEEAGFGVVTQFVGHGIGRELHEPPKVPAFWTGFGGDDFELREGMVISIEPMLTSGRGRTGIRMPVEVDARDGWTVRTADGGLSCHEERVVAVTSEGARLLGGLAVRCG